MSGSTRFWLVVAGLSGALGVAAGAYGAHGLAEWPDYLRRSFETGVHYHMWHTLALLAVAWLAERRGTLIPNLAGAAFVAGMVLFSGTLYVFGASGELPTTGTAPAGGFAFMAGWVLLAVAGLKRR